MTQRQEGRILVASGQRDDAVRIHNAYPALDDTSIEWVATSTEAVDQLRDPRHHFTIALLDRDLAPEPAHAVFNFIRRDPASPYPGLAIGLIGTGMQPQDIRRAMHAGCLLSLSRPFQPETLAAAVQRWPLDRSDFLVSGAYVGPERRRAGDTADADQRRRTLAIEQSIASTAPVYDIAPETTGFRFKRLPAGNTPSPTALSLRNGLRRATLNPAVAHIVVKKREGLGMLGRQAEAMGETWRHLQATLAPRLLTRLNTQAVQCADLSSERGLLLMGAINRSLAKYSAGRHRLGPRLVAFLRAHLDGVTVALRHRIDDDGGPTGRCIMAALKDAERRFVDPDQDGQNPSPPASILDTGQTASRQTGA
ncbi:hypothetical protein [Thalassobaculum sp.]|uniref:hypothetical protein n=1 Tax=Thalassobaculum sp. TaxID=2022740 RepID=UPI0032EE4FBB